MTSSTTVRSALLRSARQQRQDGSDRMRSLARRDRSGTLIRSSQRAQRQTDDDAGQQDSGGDENSEQSGRRAHRSADYGLGYGLARAQPLQTRHASRWPEDVSLAGAAVTRPDRLSGCALPRAGICPLRTERRIPAGCRGASPALGLPPSGIERQRVLLACGLSGSTKTPSSCATSPRHPRRAATSASARPAETRRAFWASRASRARVDQSPTQRQRLLSECAGGVLGQCGESALPWVQAGGFAVRPTRIGQRAPANGEIAEQSPRHEIVRLAPRRLEERRPGAAVVVEPSIGRRLDVVGVERLVVERKRVVRLRDRAAAGAAWISPCASERYFSARADRPTSAAPNTITTAQATTTVLRTTVARSAAGLRHGPTSTAALASASPVTPGIRCSQSTEVWTSHTRNAPPAATARPRSSRLERGGSRLGARTRTAPLPGTARVRRRPRVRARRALAARCCAAGGCPPSVRRSRK